jgi:hypothetical protein
MLDNVQDANSLDCSIDIVNQLLSVPPVTLNVYKFCILSNQAQTKEGVDSRV